MPTYGWVREDAIEAFLAGTEAIQADAVQPSPHFPCPFCSYYADQISDLQDHISDTHPIDRPCLLFNGQECQTDFIVGRGSVFESVYATSGTISIDGARQRVIKPAAIGAYLSGLQQATAIVTLTNAKQVRAAPVTSSYRLEFRIADASVLQEVEAAFLKHIVEQPLSMDT